MIGRRPTGSAAVRHRSPWITIGLVAFAAQLAGLIAGSVFFFHRFSLGFDFGIYYQGWSQIGSGDVLPWSTLQHLPFLRSHFELILWPLALLYPIFRSGLVLLVVQDIAIAGTGFVAFLWIHRFVAGRVTRRGLAPALTLVGLALLLAEPEAYLTSAQDFHMEPLVTLFVISAGYLTWSGRYRRAAFCIGLCLLCGDLGGIYVIGIGISGVIASRRTRRLGIVAVVVGVVWLAVLGAFGLNQGSIVTTGYAYLAGRAAVPTGAAGLVALLSGLVLHPERPYHQIAGRLGLIYQYLRPAGLIGMLSPWGLGVPLMIFASSGLQQNDIFLGEPFQQFGVYPFVIFGSIWLIAIVFGRRSVRDWLIIPAVSLVLVAILASAAVFDWGALPSVGKDNSAGAVIPASEASTLHAVLQRIPPDAEVIASIPIIGRFAGRRYVYLFDSVSKMQHVPIVAHTVVLVIDDIHALQVVSPAQYDAAVNLVVDHLGGTVLESGSNVVAVAWHPDTVPGFMRIP